MIGVRRCRSLQCMARAACSRFIATTTTPPPRAVLPCINTIRAGAIGLRSAAQTVSETSEIPSAAITKNIANYSAALCHAIDYQQHLLTKLQSQRESALYRALFTHMSSETFAKPTDIAFEVVEARSLHDEVLSERLHKVVCIDSDVTFTVHWRIEANKIRGFGVNNWTLTVRYHNRHDQHSDAGDIGLVDVNDSTPIAPLSSETLQLLQSQCGDALAKLPPSDFAWLLSDMLTWPSDPAFDVLSQAIHAQSLQ